MWIYKGESPPQARKNRDFGPSKRRFSKGNWPKTVQNLPKIEDSHDAHRKPPPCFVRIFELRGGFPVMISPDKSISTLFHTQNLK